MYICTCCVYLLAVHKSGRTHEHPQTHHQPPTKIGGDIDDTKRSKPIVAFQNRIGTYLGMRSSQDRSTRPEQKYRLISNLELPEKAGLRL